MDCLATALASLQFTNSTIMTKEGIVVPPCGQTKHGFKWQRRHYRNGAHAQRCPFPCQPGLQEMQTMHEASEAAWPPRQAAILAAAVKVFFQFGYRKTSMEDVTAAAEVSRRTLYLQFRHKERLFRAALECLREQMLVSIRRLAGNQKDTLEQALMGVEEMSFPPRA